MEHIEHHIHAKATVLRNDASVVLIAHKIMFRGEFAENPLINWWKIVSRSKVYLFYRLKRSDGTYRMQIEYGFYGHHKYHQHLPRVSFECV